jgi:hypothetical protein
MELKTKKPSRRSLTPSGLIFKGLMGGGPFDMTACQYRRIDIGNAGTNAQMFLREAEHGKKSLLNEPNELGIPYKMRK